MVPSYDDALGFFPRVARIRDAAGADSLGATVGTDDPIDGAPASIGDPPIRPRPERPEGDKDARPSVSSLFPVWWEAHWVTHRKGMSCSLATRFISFHALNSADCFVRTWVY